MENSPVYTNAKDNCIVINSASGFLDHRITLLHDGTATVERKENDYLATGGKPTWDWEAPKTYPSARAAVLAVIEENCGW